MNDTVALVGLFAYFAADKLLAYRLIRLYERRRGAPSASDRLPGQLIAMRVIGFGLFALPAYFYTEQRYELGWLKSVGGALVLTALAFSAYVGWGAFGEWALGEQL